MMLRKASEIFIQTILFALGIGASEDKVLDNHRARILWREHDTIEEIS